MLSSGSRSRTRRRYGQPSSSAKAIIALSTYHCDSDIHFPSSLLPQSGSGCLALLQRQLVTHSLQHSLVLCACRTQYGTLRSQPPDRSRSQHCSYIHMGSLLPFSAVISRIVMTRCRDHRFPPAADDVSRYCKDLVLPRACSGRFEAVQRWRNVFLCLSIRA